MIKLFLIVAVLVANLQFSAAVTRTYLESPDGKLRVEIRTRTNRHPYYSVKRQGRTIVKYSRLLLARSSNENDFRNSYLQGRVLNSNKVISEKLESVRYTWNPVWGDIKSVLNEYNQVVISMELRGVGMVKLLVRAFDDGVAFRYNFNETRTSYLDKPYLRDLTYFDIRNDHVAKTWIAQGIENVVGPLRVPRMSSAIRRDPTTYGKTFGAETPITMRIRSNMYLSLHEASLIQGSPVSVRYRGGSQYGIEFSTIHSLDTLGTHSFFTSTSLMRNADASELSPTCPTCSAWRTITVSTQPGGLIESTMSLNLNTPSLIPDGGTWIKPGKAMWDWRIRGAVSPIDSHVYQQDQESLKRLIRFAGSNNVRYLLLDGGWAAFDPDSPSGKGIAKSLRREDILPTTPIPTLDINELVAYGNTHGVGLFLYINDVTLRQYDLTTTLDTFKSWGIVGIKHGFPMFAPHGDALEFQNEVIAHCAQRQLHVVVHEPIKPSRLEVMFPNLLSTEYTNSMFDNPIRPAATPTDITTFPFVHGLAGPVDRSPGIFDMDNAIMLPKVHRQIPSTIVSQVAQGMVFRTGLWTLVDIPENFQQHHTLFEFVKELPMSFDEFQVEKADIGRYIVVRGRVGQSHFLAGLANESGRIITIDLRFLFKNEESPNSYHATYYLDDPSAHFRFPGPKSKVEAKRRGITIQPYQTKRTRYQVENQVYTSSQRSWQLRKRIRMRPGGGFALWLRPL